MSTPDNNGLELAVSRRSLPARSSTQCYAGGRGHTRWLLLAVFPSLLLSCAPRDEELQVQPPFAEGRVVIDSLYVKLTPGTPIESVVRLSIGSLKPGMKLEEAVAVAGPVSSKRVDSRGTYYSFRSQPPGIELAHLQYRDSGPIDKWIVTGTPADSSVAVLLAPHLLALLNRAGGMKGVTVHEQATPYPRAFGADIRDGRLLYLEWYGIEGIPHG